MCATPLHLWCETQYEAELSVNNPVFQDPYAVHEALQLQVQAQVQAAAAVVMQQVLGGLTPMPVRRSILTFHVYDGAP